MKIINHFRNVTSEEKLIIYYYIIKTLTKGERLENESTLCTPVIGQKR